jgi:hypothetical protein
MRVSASLIDTSRGSPLHHKQKPGTSFPAGFATRSPPPWRPHRGGGSLCPKDATHSNGSAALSTARKSNGRVSNACLPVRQPPHHATSRARCGTTSYPRPCAVPTASTCTSIKNVRSPRSTSRRRVLAVMGRNESLLRRHAFFIYSPLLRSGGNVRRSRRSVHQNPSLSLPGLISSRADAWTLSVSARRFRPSNICRVMINAAGSIRRMKSHAPRVRRTRALLRDTSRVCV